METFISSSLFCFCIAVSGFSQSKPYVTSGAEFIFSFANIDQSGSNGNSTLRFAPIINLQSMINRDISKKFGIFSGLAIRNVGYRMDGYKNPSDNLIYKKAFRSYNLGIPIGVKVGNLDGLFFYGGYELELGVLYKEKTYDGGDKIDKITGWFSSRQNLWQSSLMVGVQFPFAANLKFKYYLNEFNNQNYSNSAGIKPYAGLSSHVYYFSLSFFLFKNMDMYYNK